MNYDEPEGRWATITVTGIRFCAAHRIPGHPKCGRIHGHNYEVQATLRGRIQPDGMVIDFGIVKKILKDLTDPMDHRYIFPAELHDWVASAAALNGELDNVLPLPVSVTSAENLACHLAREVGAELARLVDVKDLIWVQVRVLETPTSEAVATEHF